MSALAPLLLLGAAMAQDADLDRLKPPSDHYGYFATESAETLGHLQLGLGAWVHHAGGVLVLEDPDGEEVGLGEDGVSPLHRRTVTEAQLGLGISDYFSLSAALPVVLTQWGYRVDDVSPLTDPEALGAPVLGDVRVTPKIAALSRDRFPLGAALVVPVGLPTGDGQAWAGTGGVTVSPTLAVETSDAPIVGRGYRWRVAANLGMVLRPESRVRDVEISDGVLYRVAAGFRPIEPLELVADLHGESWGTQGNQSPLELDLGLSVTPAQHVRIDAGGGIGLSPGLGSPAWRLVFGLSFAPSFDPNARDGDRDGVVDGMDACPREDEDTDGFQDDDGCPDPDNDGDGMPDAEDQCPDDAEDDDGYRDDDGCADSDNDRDGIPDISDRCPDQAELVNGFMDADGCPDDNPVNDGDGDGFNDDVDRCPFDPEDQDGFEDLDGCPDDDNDRDGILDVDDGCPNAKENFNQVEDEDGCPEAGRAQLRAGRIEITEKVFFDTGKTTISPDSYGLLDEVAQVLRDNPQVTLVQVEGHTDSDGAAANNLTLSQGRAEAVVDYLVSRGVERDRLRPVGFGEQQPVASNDSAGGKAANRRVEFIVIRTR